MNQEIELKFIVAGHRIELLREHLDTLSSEHVPPAALVNIYYETPDNWLRRHDMGLRIRGNAGQYEMTMKTAGRVTGGLHQRPEFNIPLDKPQLALERFPAEVWPQGRLPPDLTSRVAPLFSTDFDREKWLINYGESRIEIALDQGEVKAGDHREPINELELELLSGQVSDILDLARQLLVLGVLRQGSLSKAARGYHLAQGNAPRPLKKVQFQPAHDADSLKQALESALAHWQYHEEVWLRGNSAAKGEVLRAVNFIEQCLQGDHPMASEQMALVAEMIDTADSARQAAFNAQTALAKLMLTAWLVTGQ